MLFGMRPGSLCSPTHQIIGGFWNILSAAAAAPLPGHDVQTEMRGKVDVDFSSIFVCCKFHRARVDDLWGVILLFDVQSSLIQTSSGMQGQTLLWCARPALPSLQSGEGTVRLPEIRNCSNPDTFWLLSINYCEDEVWFVKGASWLSCTHERFPEKLNQIQIVPQTHGRIGGMCRTFKFSSGSHHAVNKTNALR